MLNDTKCRSAKPKAKPYRLADGQGLFLEVKPNGVRAWRYRFEVVREGKRRESMMALGEYVSAPAGESKEQARLRVAGGRLTLAEAREERAKVRALIKQGIDPVQHRQLERIKREQKSATTFEAVAREWLTLKDWAEITKKRRLDMLRRVVFPHIGKLPVRDVKPAHALDVLQRAAKDNGPSVAAEALRTMSGAFDLAVSTLRAETNPVYPVRKALPPNKTQHKTALTTEQIGQLLRDFDGYSRNFLTVAAFRLMWFTLCRPSEVMGARWEEMDLDAALWRVPAERMKKRVPHVVPLPAQAVELLRRVQGVTGDMAHVFPNRDRRDQPMSDATMRQALKNLDWSGKYSPHATRTTGSTRLNEMGFQADWIERQLAHAEPNAVRRTYNHADYLANRTRMMQQWADMLDSWKAGVKVLPLKTSIA